MAFNIKTPANSCIGTGGTSLSGSASGSGGGNVSSTTHNDEQSFKKYFALFKHDLKDTSSSIISALLVITSTGKKYSCRIFFDLFYLIYSKTFSHTFIIKRASSKYFSCKSITLKLSAVVLQTIGP